MSILKMAVRRAKRIVPRADKKPSDIKKQNKSSDNKSLIIDQEIKLAKVLAGNDKRARDKVLKHLKKWLHYRSSSTYDFAEQDFLRIWKGLFYCVWMSDKPLVQEELCENISKLFDSFGPEKLETSLLFYKCFLSTMAADWFGIDQHRLDKFLMFVRRMTRGILRCLKEQKWSTKSLESFNVCLTGEGGLLASNHPKLCLGLQMHLVDCWMEEVAKVSEGDISAKAVVLLGKPFAQFLSYGEETRLSSSITRNIFIHLCRQTDVGIEYQERLNAWKSAGFPGGSVDAMERVEMEDEDNSDNEENKPIVQKRKVELDPRAGNVDAELPQLPVDGNLFSAMFKKLTADDRSTKINRNKLKTLAKNYETLASGEYPYKMKKVVLESDPKFKLPQTQNTALDLLAYEENLKLDYEDEQMKGMNKRQRRKYLMKQRKLLEDGLLPDDDVDTEIAAQEDTNPPPAKKAKKNVEKAESGIWTVENLKESETVGPVSKPTTPTNRASQIKSNKVKKSLAEKGSNSSPKELKSPKKNTSPKVSKNVISSKSSNGDSKQITPSKTKKKTLVNSPFNLTKKASDSKTLEKSPKITLNGEAKTPTSDKTKKLKPIKDNSKCPTQTNKITPTKSNNKLTKDAGSTPANKSTLSVQKVASKLTTPGTSTKLKNKDAKQSTPTNLSKSKNSTPLNKTITPTNSNRLNASLNSSQKKVLIALKKNTSQGVVDYFKSVRQSPDIPFDGKRKPLKTSLKPSAMPSPINPFYKKKLKLNF